VRFRTAFEFYNYALQSNRYLQWSFITSTPAMDDAHSQAPTGAAYAASVLRVGPKRQTGSTLLREVYIYLVLSSLTYGE